MILWRAGLRYLLRHPLQLLFAVIGVALGVGVVVAIDLANSSANKAFSLSAEAVSGRTSHQVIGGPTGVPEEVYRRIRLAPIPFDSAPVIEGLATVPHKPGLTLRILGLDPFAEGPFRDYSPGIGRDSEFSRLLTEPGSIMLSAATAGELELRPDMQMTLQIGGKHHSVTLIGLL
ncbi:MAG: ABC transporter permease, partial [Pelovirga sp.]